MQFSHKLKEPKSLKEKGWLDKSLNKRPIVFRGFTYSVLVRNYNN